MVSRSLLLSGEAERAPPPDVVVDLIWAHATPADKLEHVRASTTVGRVDLVLFIDANDGHEAAALADRVCARATASGSIADGRAHPEQFPRQTQ
jgi:hypothetical protein